ncbi:MAG: sigma-70 family RNA polymerase sigma factor [Lachnospiraceae bacterium]|nr:sigma-70 family RNA polymerase sigma factor [Lachnospiraceae bacterium]
MKAFLTPLSCQEEKDCLMRLKNGDLNAKEELVLHNMRLVAHVAKKYQSSEEEMEDLISIGTIGLLKAVDTFDYDFGNRFATYAIRCIENELLMHFRRSKKTKMEVSLFEPIGTDKEGKQIHLMEVLLVDDVDVAMQMEIHRDVDILKHHMDRVLSPREALIIKKRYGLFGEEELTQREIAKSMGISRSYVSRIEKKALEKLKTLLSN